MGWVGQEENNPTAAVSQGRPAEGCPEPLLPQGQTDRSVHGRTSCLGSYKHPRPRECNKIYHVPN